MVDLPTAENDTDSAPEGCTYSDRDPDQGPSLWLRSAGPDPGDRSHSWLMDPSCDPEMRHGGRCRPTMFTKQVSRPAWSQIAGTRNRWSGAESEFSYPTGSVYERAATATADGGRGCWSAALSAVAASLMDPNRSRNPFQLDRADVDELHRLVRGDPQHVLAHQHLAGIRVCGDPGQERRDPALAAGNVEHRRHARSEPGRELVGLGGPHPSCLAQVLVVRRAPNSCLNVGSDAGVRLLVEIGVPPRTGLYPRGHHSPIESVTRR